MHTKKIHVVFDSIIGMIITAIICIGVNCKGQQEEEIIDECSLMSIGSFLSHDQEFIFYEPVNNIVVEKKVQIVEDIQLMDENIEVEETETAEETESYIPSNNNYLNLLSFNKGELSPEFNPDNKYYELNIGYDVTGLSPKYIAQDDKSEVVYWPYVNILNSGTTKFTVQVISENGEYREYVVNINKEYPPYLLRHTVKDMQDIYKNEGMDKYLDIIATYVNYIKKDYDILPSVVMGIQLAESGIGMTSLTAINGNNVMAMSGEVSSVLSNIYRSCNNNLLYRYNGDRGWCCYNSIEDSIKDALSFQKYGTYEGYDYFNPCGEKNVFSAICKWAYHYNPACKSVSDDKGNRLDVFKVNGDSWKVMNYRGRFDSFDNVNNPQKYDLVFCNGHSFVYYMNSWHQLQSDYLINVWNLICKYDLMRFD